MLLLVVGGLIYTVLNVINAHGNVSGAISTSITQQVCHIYLNCKGATLALYDPLKSFKDTSKGYTWNDSLQNGSCQFLGEALHVTVNMNAVNAHFHSCGVDKPKFSNFAYQVKMTFIQGDCGGILFRLNGEELYYFYICQDSESAANCAADSAEYGLIRYINDNARPSYVPILVGTGGTAWGCSQFINAGSNQTNTIAVRAQGPSIQLYVNQHPIWIGKDNNYLDGTIGVLARTFDPSRSSEVAFSGATVWTL
jgi:hypothetical protein